MAYDPSPTTQDGLSLIIQNFNNGLDPSLKIDDTNFTFDAPVVNPDTTESTKNTRLYVRPVATSGRYGRVAIYYDRMDLSAVTDKPVITRGANTLWSQVVPLINAYYGINIVAADYTDGALPAQVGATMDVTLTVKPSSLVFIGGLVVGLKTGTPAGIAKRVP